MEAVLSTAAELVHLPGWSSLPAASLAAHLEGGSRALSTSAADADTSSVLPVSESPITISSIAVSQPDIPSPRLSHIDLSRCHSHSSLYCSPRRCTDINKSHLTNGDCSAEAPWRAVIIVEPTMPTALVAHNVGAQGRPKAKALSSPDIPLQRTAEGCSPHQVPLPPAQGVLQKGAGCRVTVSRVREGVPWQRQEGIRRLREEFLGSKSGTPQRGHDMHIIAVEGLSCKPAPAAATERANDEHHGASPTKARKESPTVSTTAPACTANDSWHCGASALLRDQGASAINEGMSRKGCQLALPAARSLDHQGGQGRLGHHLESCQLVLQHQDAIASSEHHLWTSRMVGAARSMLSSVSVDSFSAAGSNRHELCSLAKCRSRSEAACGAPESLGASSKCRHGRDKPMVRSHRDTSPANVSAGSSASRYHMHSSSELAAVGAGHPPMLGSISDIGPIHELTKSRSTGDCLRSPGSMETSAAKGARRKPAGHRSFSSTQAKDFRRLLVSVPPTPSCSLTDRESDIGASRWQSSTPTGKAKEARMLATRRRSESTVFPRALSPVHGLSGTVSLLPRRSPRQASRLGARMELDELSRKYYSECA